MTTGDDRIVFDDVSVVRDGRTVLREISLEIAERRVGVIGLNGSGKSTLVRLINALVTPTEGTVTVHGMDTRKHAKQVRRTVGFVFQNPENQIIMPIVQDDIAFGLKNLGDSKRQAMARAVDALERLGIEHLAERESHTLSGGEKQMVALAGVLAMEPETIVFDEPTTMLDLQNRNRLLAEVTGLRQRAIVVTHDLDSLADFERVLVVDEAGVGYDGAPDDAISFYVESSKL